MSFMQAGRSYLNRCMFTVGPLEDLDRGKANMGDAFKDFIFYSNGQAYRKDGGKWFEGWGSAFDLVALHNGNLVTEINPNLAIGDKYMYAGMAGKLLTELDEFVPGHENWNQKNSVITFGTRLSELNLTKNSGAGIKTVADIADYISAGNLEGAIRVYGWDADKFADRYPDMDKIICEFLKIEPRYGRAKWPQ